MKTNYRFNTKELASGAVFVALALGFGIYTIVDLRIGTPGSMGPGLFPFVVSILLGIVGVLVMVRSSNVEITEIGNVSWRGMICIIGSIIVFAVSLEPLGLAPAALLAGFIAALATSRNSLKVAAIIAVVLTAICVVLFVYVLGLPIDVFGRWITGH